MNAKYYQFEKCNCKFEIIGSPVLPKSKFPALKIDWDNIPLDCPITYDLLSTGRTKGVFQLEKGGGRQGAKELKPEHIEHMSAIGALLRPGCLSYDTSVSVKISNRSDRNISLEKMKIGQLYEIFSRKNIRYRYNIVSVNEESNLLFQNRIKQIFYNGKKEVYKPNFKTYEKYTNRKKDNLECTLDHELLTYKRDWVSLDNVIPGERVAILNRRVIKDLTKKYFQGEKYYRSICFQNYEYHCVFCDWNEGSLDVNHLEGNRKNNNLPDNLCFFCPNHHRLYTENKISKEEVIVAREKYKVHNTKHIKWAEYIGKDFIGVKDVYDIEVEGPHHNFIGGNVVVHNCSHNYDKDGVSTTKHFYLRKNGIEEVTPYHPAVDEVLKDTYGCLLYQEQSIKLAEIIAGFNKQEADNLRKCITSDSLFISKSRGYITLYDMLHKGYKKDLFLTMTEDGKQYWDHITDVWFAKTDIILKITTKTGLTLKCTLKHKILTNNGWKEAGKLSINDWIVTSRLSNYDGYDIIQNDLAIVIAGIICEGHVRESSYSFVNHNNEIMNTFLSSCRKVISDQYINTNNPKVTVISSGAKNLLSKYIDDHTLSDKKRIPSEMMSCSLEQCRLFLSFMLACEGGISKNGQFEFSSKSIVLINQVRNLLRRFKIVSFLKKKIVKKYGIYYRLYINDVSSQQILEKELTCLWPSNKKNGLRRIIESKNKFCFSSDCVPKNICEKFINDGGKPIEGKINFLKRKVSFSKLKRIAHNEYWKNFANGNQYYDKIESIDIGSYERTYDFTMANSDMPYVLVNNAVIANSIGKKLPEEMVKVKKWFIEGAKKTEIVTEEQAKEIFGWIQESQRYSFNKCVSADTRIRRPNGSHPYTVEEMYHYKKGNYGKGLSLYIDGKIRPNTIKDIQPAGHQKVFKVTLKNGSSIRVTWNHKFPTNCGEITLEEIYNIFYNHVNIKLYTCDNYEKSDSKLVEITSIVEDGECLTYDVTMESPNHNFVIDSGIVTCNSHSLCYGITGYQCAYAKAHFPIESYTSWLKYGDHRGKPLEEYGELVDEAKVMGVEVYPPNIFDLETNFYTDGEIINYGISNIKGIGEKTAIYIINTIKETEKDFKPVQEWTWYEFLVLVGWNIGKTSMESLILSGAFRKLGLMRSQMMKEYEGICEINEKEMNWVKENYKKYDNIIDLLEGASPNRKEGGATHNKNRKEKLLSRASLLRNPIVPYRDNPNDIANYESYLLGASITCSIADSKPGERWTAYCKDCVNTGGSLPNIIILKVKVEEAKEYVMKKAKNEEDIGKTMAFIKVSDSTCSLGDLSCFADNWKKLKNVIVPGRVIELQLEKSYKGNRLNIKDAWMI